MKKPPKDFKGNQQDWNAIKEINSPEYELFLQKSFFKILKKHKQKIDTLKDGVIFNLNDTNKNMPMDVGVDNKYRCYVWNDKTKKWVT